MMENKRYSKAVKRNFVEVVNALHERQVLISMEEYIRKNGRIYYYGGSFLAISMNALFNDMISHIIKVLDGNKRSASFWYILEINKGKIENCKSCSEDKIKFLEELKHKLKIVRDKTHFHIDEDGVLDPAAIWSKVDVTGNELGKGIDYLLDILLELHNSVSGGNLSRNNLLYTGEDFLQLLELARVNDLITACSLEEEMRASGDVPKGTPFGRVT